jgi:membrane protease YdiL (CAAX protease family)
MEPIFGMSLNGSAKVVRLFLYTMKPIYSVPLRLPSLLLFLVGFMLTGMALGGVLSAVVGSQIYGLTLEQINAVISNPGPEHTSMLMWLNSISQLTTFLLPAVLFWLMFGGQGVMSFRKPAAIFLFVPVLWILSASPVIDALSWVNDALIPAGSWLESVALPSEERAMQLTHLFLSSHEQLGYVPLVFAIALIPAVCEEVVFRGVLQPLLIKGTGNAHVAILISSVLFSAIHLQLYGFLPRLVLGAGLGYLAWWSGSLWAPIIAHFMNNALGIAIYRYTNGSLDAETPVYVQLALLAVFALLTYFLMKKKMPQLPVQ